jgi:hypothetical protein
LWSRKKRREIQPFEYAGELKNEIIHGDR